MNSNEEAIEHARESSARFSGFFNLGEDGPLSGNLLVDGAETLLTVHSSSYIPHVELGSTISGRASSGEYLTLIECVGSGTSSVHVTGCPDLYSSELFPHYVSIGPTHLDSASATIRAISFSTRDLPHLFHDFDAFSHVIDAAPIIDDVLRERRQMRPISSGKIPLVCYFTGKATIIETDTCLGQISVQHQPSYNSGGPHGVFIRNRIVVRIEPKDPVDLEGALESQRIVCGFLSLLAGRTQYADESQLEQNSGSEPEVSRLRLLPSHRERPRSDSKQLEPHCAAIPLDPIHRSDEFCAVLRRWLELHPGRRFARRRYFDCLRGGNYYDSDRLIAAANMFDVLPAEACGRVAQLDLATAEARDLAVSAFMTLPQSPERDSALSALGRLGKPSLPKKVAHRVEIVNQAFADNFQDLSFAVTFAVKLRNFFVHGSSVGIDPEMADSFKPFLCDSLEFVFAASDLIDAGWDPSSWASENVGWGHSFARFRDHYSAAIAELRAAASSPEVLNR